MSEGEVRKAIESNCQGCKYDTSVVSDLFYQSSAENTSARRMLDFSLIASRKVQIEKVWRGEPGKDKEAKTEVRVEKKTTLAEIEMNEEMREPKVLKLDSWLTLNFVNHLTDLFILCVVYHGRIKPTCF